MIMRAKQFLSADLNVGGGIGADIVVILVFHVLAVHVIQVIRGILEPVISRSAPYLNVWDIARRLDTDAEAVVFNPFRGFV